MMPERSLPKKNPLFLLLKCMEKRGAQFGIDPIDACINSQNKTLESDVPYSMWHASVLLLLSCLG